MTNVASFNGLSTELLIGIYKTTDGVPEYRAHFTREYLLEQLNKRYNTSNGRKDKWAKTKFLALGG